MQLSMGFNAYLPTKTTTGNTEFSKFLRAEKVWHSIQRFVFLHVTNQTSNIELVITDNVFKPFLYSQKAPS